MKVIEQETKPRYVDIQGLMAYTSLGRNNALKIGEESGSKKKLGRRVIYDLNKIDSYISKL